MKTLRRFALIPALALAFVACEDSTGPEEDSDEVGEVSFRFAGDRSGTFQARGALEEDAAGEPRFGTFAAGGLDDGEFFVQAFRAGTRPKGDVFVLVAAGFNGPGTYTLNFEQCGANASCSFMVFAMGVNIENGEIPPDRLYIITEGSVVVTGVEDDRARGTFSGTGSLLDLQTQQLGAEIRITNGEFDVPVLDDDISASRGMVGALSPRLSVER